MQSSRFRGLAPRVPGATRRVRLAGGVVLAILAAWAGTARADDALPGVAVIDFQVESVLERHNPEAGTLAADHVRKRLDPKAYRILSRAQIAEALKRDNLAMVDLWAERELTYILAERADLRYAVFGRVRKRLRQWIVFARVVDCRAQKAGAEQELVLPLAEFPEAAVDGLVKQLGLKAAAPTRSTEPVGPKPPTAPMRLIQARMVEAARLYGHAGGWTFAEPKRTLLVTVGMSATALKGRKLTSQQRTRLRDAQIGDCVAVIDHTKFQVANPGGETKSAPGDWYAGFKATTRVPSPYLEGYRRIGENLRLAWKCATLSNREYFYSASKPEVLVAVVFPEVGPKGAVNVRYGDWAPVSIRHVVALRLGKRVEPGPAGATRVVSMKTVQANNIYRRLGKWVVGPSAPALEVTLALSAAHIDLTIISTEEKAALTPMPAGDYVARIDPKDITARTHGGRRIVAGVNWATGLKHGTTIERVARRGTGPAGLIWQSGEDFVRTYYAPTPDATVTVTVLFPRIAPADVASFRYKDWADARP